MIVIVGLSEGTRGRWRRKKNDKERLKYIAPV
jgi:hypothetical protein